MQNEPKVDVRFHATGGPVPVDHGYALYAAVCGHLKHAHEDSDLGIKLIRGRYIGDGMLDISPFSELVLRLPVSRLPDYLGLAGKKLELPGGSVRLGVLNTSALMPVPVVYAHLVTTKNCQDQERFQTEMAKQMAALDIHGRLSVGDRRTFSVHGRQIVGYSVLVEELTAEESIRLQEAGLGGRRKMGCGFFEPWKE